MSFHDLTELATDQNCPGRKSVILNPSPYKSLLSVARMSKSVSSYAFDNKEFSTSTRIDMDGRLSG
jgi:hypothetical protein